MDTSDALLSARDREKKAKILKDSNVGAFSVICICLLFLTDYISLFTFVENMGEAFFLLVVPFIARAVGVYILFTYNPLSTEGILAYFRVGVTWVKIAISVIMAVIGVVVCFFLGFNFGMSVLIASAISLLSAKIAEHQIGGINGDIIGFCIVVFEAVSYFVLSILL